MSRYHINGKGEPGICKARKQCPFGDLQKDHYPDEASARQAYEEHAKEYLGLNKKPLKKAPAAKSVQEQLFDMNEYSGDVPLPGLEEYGR